MTAARSALSRRWRLLSSADGALWTVLASGNFADLGAPSVEKTVLFNAAGANNRAPVLPPLADQTRALGQQTSLALNAIRRRRRRVDLRRDRFAAGPVGRSRAWRDLGGAERRRCLCGLGAGDRRPRRRGEPVVLVDDHVDRLRHQPGAGCCRRRWQQRDLDCQLQRRRRGHLQLELRRRLAADDARRPLNTASHAYAVPGLYTVTLTATDSGGTVTHAHVRAGHLRRDRRQCAAAQSSTIAVENAAGSNARVWLVNQDNDSVSVFDAGTSARLREIAVGAAPRSVAVAPDGRIWVVNKGSATVSVIDRDVACRGADDRLAARRHALRPGLCAGWFGRLRDARSARGSCSNCIPAPARSSARQSSAPIRATCRSPPHRTASWSRASFRRRCRAKSTATVATQSGGVPRGGEVVVVTAAMVVDRTVVLQHSDRPDSSVQGSGVPNYLAAPVIAPGGGSAWVPSKQDNVKRGDAAQRHRPRLPEHRACRQLAHRPVDLGRRHGRAHRPRQRQSGQRRGVPPDRGLPVRGPADEPAGGGDRPGQPQRAVPLRHRPRARRPGDLGRRIEAVRQQLHGPHARCVRPVAPGQFRRAERRSPWRRRAR